MIVPCKSCVHVRFNWANPFSIGSQYAWVCNKIMSEEEIEINPIDGKEIRKKPERKLCASARGKYGDCGPEGKLWEPKKEKDFFIYLKKL